METSEKFVIGAKDDNSPRHELCNIYVITRQKCYLVHRWAYNGEILRKVSVRKCRDLREARSEFPSTKYTKIIASKKERKLGVVVETWL